MKTVFNQFHQPGETQFWLPTTTSDTLSTPTVDRIAYGLDSLPDGNAIGPDGLPAKFLKIAAIPVAIKLRHLYGRCWQSTFLPMRWQGARLVPRPKKGSNLERDNSRGLPIGDHLSKLHLTHIPKAQCGACLGRITDMANHTVHAFIDLAANSAKGSSCVVFLDLTKACDKAIREIVRASTIHGEHEIAYLRRTHGFDEQVCIHTARIIIQDCCLLLQHGSSWNTISLGSVVA